MTDQVLIFLQSLDLEKHHEIFKIKGYDSPSDLLYLTSEDLEIMCIVDDEEKSTILTEARNFSLPDEARLEDWLREIRLDYYLENFVSCGHISLEDIQNLTIDEKLFDELEILLPGHRKRLSRAVTQLRKKHRGSESPVATGYWAKPSPLDSATHDFLCIKATVQSTRDQSQQNTTEFMVDSGSDVVTIREDILSELNLEPLIKVQSQGVHTSMEKQLYKARLQVGSESLDVEVIGGNYASVGNRVIRHFRHYIDHTKHYWLKMDDLSVKPSSSTGERSSASFKLMTFR